MVDANPNSIESHIRRTEVLQYFKGKHLENAIHALKVLGDSLRQGYWEPKKSRMVRAALSKANVVVKLARDGELSALVDLRPAGSSRSSLTDGWRLLHMMEFGCSYGRYEELEKFQMQELKALATAPSERRAMLTALRWYDAFLPVGRALAELDARRPPPVFTSVGVSPLLTETLKHLGIAAVADAVTVCPVRYEWVTGIDGAGKRHTILIVILEWPRGTRHGEGLYSVSDAGNRQCEACGHAVKKSNRIPLVLKAADGKGPYALWVGRDCSKSLFGVDMRGDFPELKEGA